MSARPSIVRSHILHELERRVPAAPSKAMLGKRFEHPMRVREFLAGNVSVGACGACGATLRGWVRQTDVADVGGVRTLVCPEGTACSEKRKARAT